MLLIDDGHDLFYCCIGKGFLSRLLLLLNKCLDFFLLYEVMLLRFLFELWGVLKESVKLEEDRDDVDYLKDCS